MLLLQKAEFVLVIIGQFESCLFFKKVQNSIFFLTGDLICHPKIDKYLQESKWNEKQNVMIEECDTPQPFSEWEEQPMFASNLVTQKFVMKMLLMN